MTLAGETRAKPRRPPLAALALVLLVPLLLYLLAQLLARPAILPPLDSVGFWAAGRLAVTGGNPYAPEQIMPLERSAGWSGTGLNMVWNPPWAMPLIMPLGLFDYRPAQLLWLLAGAVLVFFCAGRLWRYYAGPAEKFWLPLVLAATFTPGLALLKLGQMTAFVLAGVVGFLYFERGRRDWLAGLAVGVIALKPHLVFLFWPALLLWAWRERRPKVLAGAAAALVALCGLALAVNPGLLRDYLGLMAALSPADLMSPTVATILRMLAPGAPLVQYLPAAAGLAWFALYWPRRARSWAWAEQLPVLLVVSLVAAPYGWVYDQALLLVPLVQMAAAACLARPAGRSQVRQTVLSYGALDAVALALHVALPSTAPMYIYFWLAPAWALAYAAARRAVLPGKTQAPTGVVRD